MDKLCSMLSFMGDLMSLTAKDRGAGDFDGAYSSVIRSTSDMSLKTSLILRAKKSQRATAR